MHSYPVIKSIDNYYKSYPEKPELKKGLFGFVSKYDEEKFRIKQLDYNEEILKYETILRLKSSLDFKNHLLNLHLGYTSITYPKKDDCNSVKHKSKLKQDFFKILVDFFDNNVTDNFVLDIFNKAKPLATDFVYYEVNKNLFINIEIDEPYGIYYDEGKPKIFTKNTIGSKDDRDQYFIDKGWFVVRFAEEQIVKYPASCCKTIAELIFKTTFNFNYLKKLAEVKDVVPIPLWSNKTSKEMGEVRYRDTYLGNNLFTTFDSTKSIISKIPKYQIKYEAGTDKIEKITTYNLDGKKVEIVYYKENLPSMKCNFIFSDGKIVEEIIYSFHKLKKYLPILNSLISYEYKNNVLHSKTVFLSGHEINYIYYFYDNSGKLMETVETGKSYSRQLSKLFYINDVLIKTEKFKEGKLDEIIMNEYDYSNNVIKSTKLSASNDIISVEKFEYANNKITKHLINSKKCNDEVIYKYDSLGNNIEVVTKGSAEFLYNFNFNAIGKITKKILRDKNKIICNDDYEYIFHVISSS